MPDRDGDAGGDSSIGHGANLISPASPDQYILRRVLRAAFTVEIEAKPFLELLCIMMIICNHCTTINREGNAMPRRLWQPRELPAVAAM